MNFNYPKNLPITERRKLILETIQHHPVVIIAGDTGSGKTTQLPKMCLEAFPDNDLLIGCTQPRRIAASTVASRVAEELGEAGDMVGYKIRFHDYTTPATKIKFMTDGVLLAETRHDRLLKKYGVLIIDEAHERSLNIDFLLGYIKQLRKRRKDLKVIITSATIDTQAFSKHFDDAPVISVTGRSYPVTIRYQPPEQELEDEKDGGLDHCVQSVCELLDHAPPGDILVFLPTERDIRDCCQLLENKVSQAVILPIFGRLPGADQRRIFQNFNQTKIVVATNVAETSVTVPGIRYVVDSGLARISYYNVRAKTTSLPVTRISRASCDQRKGRCGRVGPGLCIRLYSEEDYNDRPEFTLPELKRSNLAEVILQMTSLKLGDPENFPFLDPPYKNSIKEGYRLLKELGAINNKMQLTDHGRIMADLPIDPCIARIIIEAKEHNCLREIKIISAALAIQDPRIRPAEKEKEADAAHNEFGHPHSDFMVLLNIWNKFHDDSDLSLSWSRLKKYCKKHYLSFQRMREWFDLHKQLSRIIERREGFIDNVADGSYEQIHKSFLAGLLRNLAKKKQGRLYQGSHNKELMIFPGSHQFTKGGQWLVAASFIETSRLYALTVATIEPDWIEGVAGNLCKYSWTNPRWHKKSGRVVAEESASLFGLIIASGRKVNYGRRSKKNIQEARDIFIQAALVAGELNGNYRFLEHNLQLIKKWQNAEDKLRVKNIVVDDLSLHAFYDKRLPADVYDQATLNRFLKRKRNKSFLQMTDQDVLNREPEERELVDYPPTLSVGNMMIRLEYHFEPGSDRDGVTFRLPVNFAATVSPELFEWLVPGLLHEKLTFLLKGLPKSIRKKLVPISDTVNMVLDDIDHGTGSFYSSLESSLLKHFKLMVRHSDWSKNLPAHLQARFLLFDDSGKELCTGRNLLQLLTVSSQGSQTKSAPELRRAEQKLLEQWQDTSHTSWNFSGLPASIPTYTPQGEVAGFLYPLLTVQSEEACVKIGFDKDKRSAELANIAGILYLYRLQFKDQYKALKKLCSTTISGPSSVWLMNLGNSRKEVIDTFLTFILSQLFGPLAGTIVSEAEFSSKIQEMKKRGLYAAGQDMCNSLMSLVRKRRDIQQTIERICSPAKNSRQDQGGKGAELREHLEDIFPMELFKNPANSTYPTKSTFQCRKIDLINLERQLQCLHIRLDRFQGNPPKDSQKAKQLQPYLQKLYEIKRKEGKLSESALEQLDLFEALVNEYRISLFSPELKTRQPVSPKKLDQQWSATLTKC